MNPNKYFVLLLVNNVIASISLSLLSPFFPPFAKSKGISQGIIGFIFSAHPLGSSLTALKIGSMINKDNKSYFMSIGLLTQGICLICLACTHQMENALLITVVALITRISNGIGTTMFYTSFYATIPLLSDKNVESKIAIGEFVNSLGFMIGPVIGSILFKVGNVATPYLTFALLSIFSGYLLKINGDNVEFADQLESPIKKGDHQSYIQLLKNYYVLILFLLAFASNNLFLYYIPLLANFYAKSYSIKPEESGFYMFGGAAGYALGAQLLYCFPLKQQLKHYFLIGGLLITSFAQFFYGPDQLIYNSHSIFVSVVAQFISGFTILFPYATILPYLNKYIGLLVRKNKNGLASALFTLATALGDLSGPLLSGILAAQFGFSRTASIFGLLMLIVTVSSIPLVYKEYQETKIQRKDAIELQEIINEE